MTILTPAAFLAIAAACAPGLDAKMLQTQAQRESGLNTAAIHHNTNATTDYGLMQINSANFALLGLRSEAEALDPCRNVQAAQDLYFTLSRYNSGHPTASLTYASAIVTGRHDLRGAALSVPPPCAPAWDAWATAACSKPTGTQTAQETAHAN